MENFLGQALNKFNLIKEIGRKKGKLLFLGKIGSSLDPSCCAAHSRLQSNHC